MSLEDTFSGWAQGPGKTEQEKSENAETAIKKAVAASDELSKLDISVFAQGSYRARTNVKQDSDVDICVRLNKPFFADYPPEKTDADFGNTNAPLTYAGFKDMVHNALNDYFGSDSVTRGKKAFDVHANSYRIDADVVPTLEYRWYTGRKNSDGTNHYHAGVAFVPDNSTNRIINWPQQTFDNGVQKNDTTGRRYKRMIRIVKRLRNEMQEEKVAAANDLASYLIECLAWNVLNEGFNHDTYTADVRYVLAHTFNATQKDETCKEWGEVNELKYLFRPSQPWTREQAHSFLAAAWDYIGFK